jgi:hypothetical protein
MENAYFSIIMSERKMVLRRWEDNIEIDMCEDLEIACH